MAIVSCNLLWRNLWCKKEKRGFKEVYQLSDLSPLTSTPPTSLPDSHPSPSPLKFSLKSTAHRVTQCCRGLKERCWRRVIGQSERVGVGGVPRSGCWICGRGVKEKHWTHMWEALCGHCMHPLLMVEACACVCERVLLSRHCVILTAFSPGFYPCARLSSTITFCLPHKQTLYSSGWEESEAVHNTGSVLL